MPLQPPRSWASPSPIVTTALVPRVTRWLCDQLEDPKLTKKLVKRGITELVTPGVALSDNVLNYKENNFLAAVHFGKASFGVAFLDISTGEFLTGEGTADYVEKLLGSFSPKEVLFDRSRKQDFERLFGTKFFTFQLDDWVFTDQTSKQKLLRHFNVKKPYHQHLPHRGG